MIGTKRIHARNERKSPVTEMAVTLGIMYAISALMLLLLAFLLFQFDLSESVVKIGILAAYIASNFFGGFFIGRRMEDKKYLWGLLAGVVYFVLLFVLSWLLKQGMSGAETAEPVNLVTTGILCAVSGMTGGMLS